MKQSTKQYLPFCLDVKADFIKTLGKKKLEISWGFFVHGLKVTVCVCGGVCVPVNTTL